MSKKSGELLQEEKTTFITTLLNLELIDENGDIKESSDITLNKEDINKIKDKLEKIKKESGVDGYKAFVQNIIKSDDPIVNQASAPLETITEGDEESTNSDTTQKMGNTGSEKSELGDASSIPSLDSSSYDSSSTSSKTSSEQDTPIELETSSEKDPLIGLEISIPIKDAYNNDWLYIDTKSTVFQITITEDLNSSPSSSSSSSSTTTAPPPTTATPPPKSRWKKLKQRAVSILYHSTVTPFSLTFDGLSSMWNGLGNGVEWVKDKRAERQERRKEKVSNGLNFDSIMQYITPMLPLLAGFLQQVGQQQPPNGSQQQSALIPPTQQQFSQQDTTFPSGYGMQDPNPYGQFFIPQTQQSSQDPYAFTMGLGYNVPPSAPMPSASPMMPWGSPSFLNPMQQPVYPLN